MNKDYTVKVINRDIDDRLVSNVFDELLTKITKRVFNNIDIIYLYQETKLVKLNIIDNFYEY
jgi:hypothetical protein